MLIQDIISSKKTADTQFTDVSMANFVAEVLEASHKKVVLVDFWAPWCGPCKTLDPLLKKVVPTYGGRVVLCKVNVDQNQPLAAQLRVQSVPTVYAFIKGQPVDAFAGVVPEQQLKAFIDALLTMMGPLPTNEDDQEAHRQQTWQQFKQENYVEACRGFMTLLARQKDDENALAGLAHCYLMLGRIDEAKGIAMSLPRTPHTTNVLDHLILLESIANDCHIHANDREEAAVLYRQACEKWGLGSFDDGANLLLTAFKENRSWANGLAKERLLTLFQVLGSDHALVIRLRKKLSTLLFA